MSTILNTLKKLEENKSVLEKNIDLKGLVTQGDESPHLSQRNPVWKIWLFSGFLFGGVLLGIGITFLFNPSGPKIETLKDTPNQTKRSSMNASVDSIPGDSHTGIPLASIPEPMTEDSRSFEEDYELIASDEMTIIPAETEEINGTSVEEEPSGLREVDSLIKSATAETVLEENDQNPISENASIIPGLSVKGIIFLAPDNPFNHILVSTPSTQNRKLKVGETVAEATLESIQANKVVFLHRGEQVEISIGQ